MSTRVQKGGTVFRPVAKVRARPATDAARVASAGPDSQNLTSSSERTSTIPTHSVVSDAPLPVETPVSVASYRDQSMGPPADSVTSSRITPSPDTRGPPSVHVVPNLSQPSLPQPSGASHATLSSIISSTTRAAAIPLVSNSRAVPIVSGVPRAIQQPTRPVGWNPIGDSHTRPSNQTYVQPSTPADVTPLLNQEITPPFPPDNDGLLQFDFSAVVSEGARAGALEPSETRSDQPAPNLAMGSSSAIDPPSQTEDTLGTGDAEGSVRPKRTLRKRTVPVSEASQQDSTSGSLAEAPVNKKRKRIRKAASDPEEGEASDTATERRTRKTKDGRKSRAASVAVFDPDADPGEDLDPTTVTMAMLCDDTGQGRVSSKAAQILSNHAAWKKSNRERRARMRATMEAKKYGRNEDDAEDIAVPNDVSSQVAGPSSSNAQSGSTPVPPEVESLSEAAVEGSAKDGFDYTQSIATSRFNVQVRIGPNGETIVDEESLFVDRAEDQDTDNYTHVEESDATKFVNSATYGKKFRGSRWSAEETELFFDALSQFGENYELISYVLPGRDHIQTLTRMTGKDFSGPTPIIRAKTPPNMAQLDASAAAAGQSPSIVRKQSQTPGLDGDTDGGQSEAEGAETAGQKGRHTSRKAHARRKKDDGVEVLGTIDDGEWE
ncbi:hypothetical protein EVG20_g217 [Dentipellis fragilis]|uniref:Transcription factor TFIIIB component B'' Myb domain-containing protein n=1 Tax=Dentipellis fragilis TaxID=205917 RepID=A0A4Y9ZDW6_9AGAM|nr:hypothetical protein EVG20_g217 [Dentipellis fragilis]